MPEEQTVVDDSRLSELAEDVFGEEIDDTEAVEEVEEAVEAEGDSTDDDDDSQQETAEAEATETVTPEPATDDRWDKALQQSQQLNASYEKLIEKMAANPTPETQLAVETTKSKLDLIAEAKDEDVDPYTAAKTVADEVRLLQADREKRTASDQETIAALRQQLEANDNRQVRIEFRQDHPELAGQYDDLVAQLTKEMKPLGETGGGNIPADTWDFMVNTQWENIVTAAKAKVAEAKTKTEDAVEETVKKPVGTNPVKQKKGTRKKPAPDRKAHLAELRDSVFGDD